MEPGAGRSSQEPGGDPRRLLSHIAPDHWRVFALQTLEAMVSDRWVRTERDPDKPCLKIHHDLLRHRPPVAAG